MDETRLRPEGLASAYAGIRTAVRAKGEGYAAACSPPRYDEKTCNWVVDYRFVQNDGRPITVMSDETLIAG